jgi:hypothetical protein
MLPPYAVRYFPAELTQRAKYDELMAAVAAELAEQDEAA